MEATSVSRRYRIDRRLGEGGMAEVFLGHDLLLNRPVAIKKLHGRYAGDAPFRARFEREAERAGSLSHPNIIEIYDVGEEDGRPYIVMEYVAGDSLKNIIRQEGPFDPDDVAALLEQVAPALDYAHERGIVHRDIKPQNIMVDTNGLAKVVDFGIAKGVGDASLTDLGTALGTAHYVSPEQASGLMATPASDIYSMGVVAFEMLTRHVPFDGDSSVSIAIQHIDDPPPKPSSYQPYLVPAVDAIIERVLNKNPTLRFRSAGNLASAMSEWRHYDATRDQFDPPREPRLNESETMMLPIAPRPTPPTYPPAALPGVQLDTSRDAVGRGTWFIGVVVLLTLIALVWFGASLTDGRFGSSTGAIATTTEIPGSTSNDLPSGVVGSGAMTSTATLPPELAMPSVTGLDPAAATGTLRNLGLLVQEGQPVYSRAVASGDIAEQDPPAGTALARGRTVVVKRSLGSPEIDLSSLDLVGQPADEALDMLNDYDLNVVTEDLLSSDVERGSVVRVEPEARAMVGDTVTLFVSADP